MASPSPEQRESRPLSTSRQPSSRKPKFSDSIGTGAHAARGSQGMTWQATQRVWLPPAAGPWCDVIAGTRYIKFANDESLAREEGGGHNVFMEVVTYKTVQGRQLRMTLATATIVFRVQNQLLHNFLA